MMFQHFRRAKPNTMGQTVRVADSSSDFLASGGQFRQGIPKKPEEFCRAKPWEGPKPWGN
jgi:hypothetical protein